MSSIKFCQTNDPEKIKQIYTLCGSQWSGKLSAEEYGEMVLEAHLDFINQRGGELTSFYLEDTSNGKTVSCTTVRVVQGFYKPGDKSNVISSIPDSNQFGVKNVTILLLGYVFTDENYRGRGLAEQCISSAIQSTEQEILNRHIEDNVSDGMRIGNFKDMVMNKDGRIDQELANYYLSKQYFWMLCSGVNTYYERFGFKSYPLDFYKIPTSILSESQEKAVIELIKGNHYTTVGTEETEQLVGKHLKLLKGDNESDQDIIKFILQTKELQMITELNRTTFHTELQHGQKSSSSLLNMKEAVSIMPQPESGSNNKYEPYPSPTKTPPVMQATQTIPKIAIKPSYDTFQWNVHCEVHDALPKYNPTNPNAGEFTNIQGAIITNELQQRSYYILWNTLMHTKFFILGIGEIKFQRFKTGENQQQIPRRGSSLGSFSTINELGGYNFQDLDILISTAIYVAKQRYHEQDHVLVSANDLPDGIPNVVMYDFFMNYLPMVTNFYEDCKISSEEQKQLKDCDKVEFVKNAAKQLNLLPMLKMFGSNNPEFELDWVYSGMLSWG